METSFVLLVTVLLTIPAVVILVPRWMRSRERQRILETVMQAAEKGISLPESVIQSLIRAAAGVNTPIPTDPSRDMRRGVFLVMIGLSIALLGLAVFAMFVDGGVGPAGILLSAIGAIPLCIGFGYISVARMGERARKSVIE